VDDRVAIRIAAASGGGEATRAAHAAGERGLIA